MSRQELVAAATAAGIAKASSKKSADLEAALAEMNLKVTKKEGGKRGRPIKEGSARQAKIAAREARVAENGGVVKRGRPIVEGSVRQARLAAKAEGKMAKRGRPAKEQIDIL